MNRLETCIPAPGALAEFQTGFARALFDEDASKNADIDALKAQPAFAVYRNTVIKACIDALQANYPAVSRLVGDEWFRAAAVIYVREYKPRQPMLLQYGTGFADFLTRFEPVAELPYLPGVARLDRYWTEAHVSADEHPLDNAAIADLAAGNFFRVWLRPHTAARWTWFDDAPVYTIWSRNRSDTPVDGEIDWHGEGALLTRPFDVVQWVELDRAGCAFLDACAAGETLAGAAQAALEINGEADLAEMLSTLLAAGAFGGMHMHEKKLTEE